jgi:pre-rRNA-processing protein TSR3
MEKDFASIPPRSLSNYKTAYPRVSKLGTDPENGLASIEALYVAYVILGRDPQGLLDNYHWKKEFLELNTLPGS